MESFNRMVLILGMGFAVVVVVILYGMSSTAFEGIGDSKIQQLKRSILQKKTRAETLRESIAAIEAEIEEIDEQSKLQNDLLEQVKTLETQRDEYNKQIEQQRNARKEIIAEYGRKHRSLRSKFMGTEVDEIVLDRNTKLQNVKFTKIDDDRVSLAWSGGLKGMVYDELPSEWQKKMGFDAELDELLRIQEDRVEEEPVIIASSQTHGQRSSTTPAQPRKKTINPMDSARISRLERTNVLLEQRIIATHTHINDLESWIRTSASRPRGKISARDAVVTRKQNQITSLRNWIARARATIANNNAEIRDLRN